MADIWSKKITRDGVSSLINLSKLICKFVGLYGTTRLRDRTTLELASALELVRTACLAWEALDDHAGKIDRTPSVEEPFDGVPEG